MTYVPAPSSAAVEAENVFYLRSAPGRLAKLLAHYELYRQITGLPGAVVELGVYKGASLMRFATFRALLEHETSRAIHGFDAFGAFPSAGIDSPADRAFIAGFEAAGGAGISCALLEELIAAKGFGNVRLHAGDVFDTLPALLTAEPALRVALLHLDLDVYEPTVFALDRLLPRMAPGGLILFDDYGFVEGATRAAETLARTLDRPLEKLPLYAAPTFLRVP